MGHRRAPACNWSALRFLSPTRKIGPPFFPRRSPHRRRQVILRISARYLPTQLRQSRSGQYPCRPMQCQLMQCQLMQCRLMQCRLMQCQLMQCQLMQRRALQRRAFQLRRLKHLQDQSGRCQRRSHQPRARGIPTTPANVETRAELSHLSNRTTLLGMIELQRASLEPLHRPKPPIWWAQRAPLGESARTRPTRSHWKEA